MLQPSEAAYDLIKCFESFRAKAYWCPGKKLTIGYGTTRGVRLGQTVTHAEAIEMLKVDVSVAADDVRRLVTVPLNQNQFDALVSFTHNVGGQQLATSTLRRVLNAGDYEAVPAQLVRWKYSRKIFMRGLLRRRQAEVELWRKSV